MQKNSELSLSRQNKLFSKKNIENDFFIKNIYILAIKKHQALYIYIILYIYLLHDNFFAINILHDNKISFT